MPYVRPSSPVWASGSGQPVPQPVMVRAHHQQQTRLHLRQDINNPSQHQPKSIIHHLYQQPIIATPTPDQDHSRQNNSTIFQIFVNRLLEAATMPTRSASAEPEDQTSSRSLRNRSGRAHSEALSGQGETTTDARASASSKRKRDEVIEEEEGDSDDQTDPTRSKSPSKRLRVDHEEEEEQEEQEEQEDDGDAESSVEESSAQQQPAKKVSLGRGLSSATSRSSKSKTDNGNVSFLTGALNNLASGGKAKKTLRAVTKGRGRRAKTPESLQSEVEEVEQEEVEEEPVAEGGPAEKAVVQKSERPTEPEPKDDISDRIVVEVRDSQEPEQPSQELAGDAPANTQGRREGESASQSQDVEMGDGTQNATQGSEPKTKASDDFDWEVPDEEEQDENKPPKLMKLLSSPITPQSNGKMKRRASASSRRLSYGTSLQHTPRPNGTARSNATPRRKPGRRAIVNSSPEPEGEAVDEFFNARTSLQKYLPRITNSKLISTLPELFQSDHTQVSRDIAKIGAASREIRNFIDRNKSSTDKQAIGKDLIRKLVKEVETDFDGLKKLASLLNDFGPRIRTVTAQLGGLLEDMKEVAEGESEEEEEYHEVEEGEPLKLSTANAERVTVEGFGNHKNRRYPEEQEQVEEEEEAVGEDTQATILPPPRTKGPIRAALAVNHEQTSEVDPYDPMEASLATVVADSRSKGDGNEDEAESVYDDDDWKEEELVALFEGMESVHGERKIQKIYEKYSKALSGKTLEEVIDKVAQVRKGFEDEGLTVNDVGAGWWSEA